MTVYSNERTFRCNANASVWEPTLDPDRPHCVMINMHNYVNDYTTPWVKDAHARITFHSKYPIYPHYYEDYSGSYVGLFVFSTQESHSDPTQSELLYELESDSILASDEDTGRNRFQAHNFGFYADRTILIRHNPQTGEYTPANCIATDPFTLRLDRPSEAGNKLSIVSQQFASCTPKTHSLPEHPLSTVLNIYWLYRTSMETRTWIYPRNVDRDNGYIEEHDTYSLFNFNNPLFASGQAWLDYCKEHV